MKKKLDIQMNPARPSSGEIARRKDFDALLEAYATTPKQRPIIRKMYYYAAAAAAAIAVIFLSLHFLQLNDYENRQAEWVGSQPFINPPLEQIKPQFTANPVSSQQGGVIEYPSGSKITVPAAAFVAENGGAVEGEVTIHYREMHDFVDFFMSGIPMTYDSAGVQYTLESAGMIEIFAEQGGKRVNMAPGKSLDVELVSKVNTSPSMTVPPGYNIYKLNEIDRRWEYREIDRMTVIEENESPAGSTPEDVNATPEQREFNKKMREITLRQETELANIEASRPKPALPLKPEKKNNSQYVFDLDFSDLKVEGDAQAGQAGIVQTQNELAELYKQYERILWQLSPKTAISPEQLEREFGSVSGISIQQLNERDFEITLQKKQGEAVKIIANPVLSGKDYEKAQLDFNSRYAAYQKQVEERESALSAQKDALRKEIEEQKKLAELAYEDRISRLKEQGRYADVSDEVIKRKVVNRFTATGFGIWNCDRPLPPFILVLKGSFKDQFGKSYDGQTGYFVDKSRNTVTRFLASDHARMSFDLNSDNLLWVITEDNKIAVFRPESFKQIKKGTKNHEFVLEKIDKEIKDERDVREILYL